MRQREARLGGSFAANRPVRRLSYRERALWYGRGFERSINGESIMKLNRFVPGLVAGVLLGGAVSAFAAAKTYQYTGAVTSADAKQINVDKNGDVWEFAIDGDTKGTLDAKKGDKVTVTYRMYATKIEKK